MLRLGEKTDNEEIVMARIGGTVAALAFVGGIAAATLGEQRLEAAFTGYTVVATPVTSGGQNLIRYEVFANFNGATDTVLNVFNLALVSTSDPDPYGNFWHKDISDYNGGVLSQQQGTWAPQLVGSATANRPFDSFLLIGGNPTGANASNADPSWTSGGSGSHAGNSSSWQRPDLVNNHTLGWFNSSPPSQQGRVGVAPNTATQVKLGQFVLSQGHGTRTYSLTTGWNNGAGSGVGFGPGTFTLCSITAYRDLDGDGFGSEVSGTALGCPTVPAGYVLNNTDCNDADAAINPNTVWSRDVDGDGFGAAASGTLTQCAQPSGYVLNNLDCDEGNAAINPNTIWSRDLDGDGYGFAADGTLTQCAQPTGYVLNNTDNCPSIANVNQADCNGNSVGDVCEIANGTLADCDADGTPDICEGAVIVDLTSPLLAPFGNGFPVNYTFTNLPKSYRGTPQLIFEATSDLNLSSEFISVALDGGTQEFFFVAGGTDCPATPDLETKSFTVPALNALVADGSLTVAIVASGTVDAAQCAGGGIRVRLRYDGLPSSADCNGNGVLDSCEIGTGAQPDCNANGKPDACDIASGYAIDCNANGVPDTCDIASGTSTDLNANGKPDECSGEFIVGGSGFASIQAAIAAAPDGATIRVGAGTYGPVVLSGRQLTLQSLAGAATTFIDGGGATRCVNFVTPGVGPSLIEGFTLRNGRAGNGAAVNVVGATLEIRACVFRDNTSTNAGGAVSALDSNVTIFDSEFRNNTAVRGGAIHSEVDLTNALVQVVGCFIIENSASTDGGAISNAGNIRVRECELTLNTAGESGGGLWTQLGSVSELLGVRMCRNAPTNIVGAIVDLGGNTFSQDCNENGICDADEIAAGTQQDCNANGIPDACDLNGSVLSWGDNDLGQLDAPPAYLLGELKQIAAGCGHSLALRADGTVVGWGANAFGQATVPAGLTGVVQIAAGCDHNAALRADGTVVCWGANASGQCIVPAGLMHVVQVAAGGAHTAALRADGTVVCWGRNVHGESTVPSGLANVAEIACGGAHTVARRTNGTAICWGLNNFGQTTLPSNLGTLKGITAGCYHTVGLRTDGTVVAWGSNLFGERTVPPNLTNVIKVSAGVSLHTIALKTDGSARAWGWNDFGQLAVPSTAGPFAEVVAGGSHSFARTRGAADCNDNNLLDSCEIASGALADCDGDGVLDLCEITLDPTLDCDGNGVLNSCEIASGAADCNSNGKPDTCDLVAGTSTDLNGNGKPDECAGEYVVGGTGFTTIQAAVNAAPNGATIQVAAGTYGAVDLTGRALVLRSLAGAAATFIDGGESARCLTLGSAAPGLVEIDGFTIRNGRANNGGGLVATLASPIVRNCIFTGNVATQNGGAVANFGGAPQFFDCDFIENVALQGGAIAAMGIDESGAAMRVERCDLLENVALGAGGAVYNDGAIDFVDCVIEANVAGGLGGGLFTIGTAPSRLATTRLCRNVPNNTWGAYIDLGGNIFSDDCNANGLCDFDEITAGTEQDCNTNGIPDSCDLANGTSADCNENGVPDSCDIASGSSTDVDSNGIPDDCKPDCDNDGLPDAWELAQGLDSDCNANATIDRCEIAKSAALDCDIDGVLDSCEIAAIPALDCDGNGVLDSCQIASNPALDCNGNGGLDTCDIAAGADDCDANGRIDACDISDGAEDKNDNGALDTCELARGDLDLDGVVSASDLAVLLVFWGAVNPPAGDLTGDGVINGADLSLLLSNWGTTP